MRIDPFYCISFARGRDREKNLCPNVAGGKSQWGPLISALGDVSMMGLEGWLIGS